MAREIAADSDDESTRSSQKENISPVKQDKGKEPERAVRRGQKSLVAREGSTVDDARELRNIWKNAAEGFIDHARQGLQLAQLKANHSAANSLQQAEEAKHADAVKQANDALDARNNAKERSRDLKDQLSELMQAVSEPTKERFSAALGVRIELENRQTKSKWYPALQSIVSDVCDRFEAAFSQIRCNGTIEIKEDEDYAKWALILKVAFRDDEKLTELSATSQSDGERAVSTIFFLMALVVRTKAPFSLVDENNQGMDPRYERSVHGQFVDVTCNSDCPQYFLLTPKFLPDLKYNKDMKVLCISKGEWLLDNPPDGDIERMLDNYERMNGVAGSSK